MEIYNNGTIFEILPQGSLVEPVINKISNIESK
jgi:hypothetical protein